MMKNVPKRATAVIAALAAVALLPLSAQALERVGPVDPANGFPLWYQDTTGVTLDLCVPQSTAEADWCQMVPAEMLPVTIPESFPNNWSTEHFWWLSGAVIEAGTNGSTVTADLTLGLESTFAADAPIAGDQITFGRIRVRIDDLEAGTYRVYTPFKVYTFEHTEDGARFRYVEDLGATCAQGTFDCALQSNLGPFLLPSATPGGDEEPPISVEATGRRYIANPNETTAVTGSRLAPFTDVGGTLRNPNIFLIERLSGETPAVLGFTTEFTLMGRLFEGTIVADAKVDRASYASDGAGNQVDVYATGFPARPARDPGDPVLAEPPFPTIGFYSVPCEGESPGPFSAPVGFTPVPLARNGSVYWAKEEPATAPAAICVEKNLTSNPADATYESIDPLGDQVFVTRAEYVPATQTLVVEASSSDLSNTTLELLSFGDIAGVPFVNGVATVPNVNAPPSEAHVSSFQGGFGRLEVTTRGGEGPVVNPPAAEVTLAPNQPSPHVQGTEVVWVAAATGSAGYEYQFWLNTAGVWSVVQPYSSSPTWTMPAGQTAGSYIVAVWVRTNPTDTAYVQSVVNYLVVPPPPATVALSQETVNTEIVWTATATGSTGYEYQFWYRPSNEAAWRLGQAYTTSPTWTMPAVGPGEYLVAVWVRTHPYGAYNDYVQALETLVIE